VLGAAGPNCRIADPLTWPEQAGHAVAGRWGALKALQDTLIGGRRVIVRSPARTARNPSTTSTDAWQMFHRVDWTLAAGMALALLAVLGLGPGGRNCQAAASVALQPALVMPADRAPQRLS
jgi:hypothetical protein